MARHAYVFLLAAALAAGCGRRTGRDALEKGMDLLARGDFEGAVAGLEQAARQLPDSPTVQCNLGMAYWKIDLPERAVTCLRQAAELAPEDPAPLELLGRVFIDVRRWEDARAALAEAYRRSSLSPAILNAMGVVEFHAGETEQAMTLLKRALALDTDYPPALYNLGVLHGRASETGQQERYLRRYVEIGDDERHTQAAYRYLDPQRHEPSPAGPLIEKARAAVGNDAYDEALVLLNQAVREDPESADAAWELALLYDRHLGYAPRALDAYRRFAESFPADARVALAGERRRALRAHSGATENESSAPAQGRAEAAREAFRKGLAFHQRRDWRAAIGAYKEALSQDSRFAQASCNLGLAHKASGDTSQARDAFLYTLSVDPNMLEANYMLGVVYRDLGQAEKAVSYLKRTLAVDPGYARAHLLLGLIHRQAQRIEQAKQHFRRFVDLAPADPSAQKIRDWLRAGG